VIVVPVALPGRPYDVVIGRGARHELASVIGGLSGVRQAAVVTQPAVVAGGWLEELDTTVPFEVHRLGEGEGAKSLASVETLCSEFARSGLSRSDVVVAVGGGVVTDVAGFAAASYHRGMRYVNVATTLLGQVDAAIGGKTGVNIAEGKNLVGAFWQPSAVLCDTETLGSLPPREWRCGRGEMAKYAFLGPGKPDASLLELDIDEQVARCVAIKAAVVAADETEEGGRMVLNYGHTLGHALEAEGFGAGPGRDLAHGEAVAIGLVFAALLARRLGRIDDERVELHRRVVAGFDLTSDLPAGTEPDRVIAAMGRDKKARHDLTFVLDGPNGVEPVSGVGESDVVATLAEMGSPQ
jgi:5-deoxy-5-amino-3-dehydroquinate synthase